MDCVGDVESVDASCVHIVRVSWVSGAVVGVLKVENGGGLVASLLAVAGDVFERYDVVSTGIFVSKEVWHK